MIIIILVLIFMVIYASNFLHHLINVQSSTFTTSVRTYIEVYNGITIFKITKEVITRPNVKHEKTLFEKIGMNRILCILLLSFSIPMVLLLRNNRRRIYNVSVNVRVNEGKEKVMHKSKSYRNLKRLVKVIIDVDHIDPSTLYRVLKKLCNIGYKFILEDKTLNKISNSEIVDKLSLEKCVVNKYVERNIQEIPYAKLSELLNIYSIIEENERKQTDTNYVRGSNEFINTVKRFMNLDDELYYRLKKGLHEQEMKNLPREYKILIEELRKEGIVYKDRNGVYKIVE